jgi:hypothetical protein
LNALFFTIFADFQNNYLQIYLNTCKGILRCLCSRYSNAAEEP